MTTAISRSRWVAKKVARRGLALGASWARRLSPPRGPSAARVVTYHRFGDLQRDPFAVSARDFERHVAHLAGAGLAVSLSEIERFVAGQTDLRDGSVLVTIDDGFESLLRVAAPILARHGVPAVAFVAAGRIGTGHPADVPERFLTFDELSRVEAHGVEIASHGLTHRSLGALGLAAAREEALRSRELLESTLGHAVTALAYPYGMRGDHTPETRAILGEAGYRVAFTAEHGPVRAGDDALTLTRVKVEGGDPDWLFPALCRGAMDGWRHVEGAIATTGRVLARGAP